MNYREEQNLIFLLFELMHKQELVTVATQNFGPDVENTTILIQERNNVVTQILNFVNYITPPIELFPKPKECNCESCVENRNLMLEYRKLQKPEY
jgi:hypothetical protein